MTNVDKMKNKITLLFPVGMIICALLSQFSGYSQTTNLLTATVKSGSNSGYYYLINHGDMWHYRFGTNAPQSNWKTVSDSGLDSTWLLGPAGFGYEDGDDATVLNNMSNRFTTLYIRRTFTIDNSIDLSATLQLIMDYDDAFIAWIDGNEVARSSNAPGQPGTEPQFNSVSLPPNHEALGYRGLPPEIYDLGSVGSRLQPGKHVLAIMGFNASLNSSDFSLIPDLRIVTTANDSINGNLFSFAFTNKIILEGSNTVSGSVKTLVNGFETSYNQNNGTYQFNTTLKPGVNRFFVSAMSASGDIIVGTNKYVVLIENLNKTGGVLSNDTIFIGNGSVTQITNDLIVQPYVTLSVQPGAVILMNPAASIILHEGASLKVEGSEDSPVFFIPSDGSTEWGTIRADGANSLISISNAVITAGQISGINGANVIITDSTLRDLITGNRFLLSSTNALNFAIKRTHVSNYGQIRFSSTPVTIEDSLFENIYSDGCDFADSQQIVLRRTTFRYGYGSNTDAIDLGNNPSTILDNLLIHHIPDKAVSIADFSHQTVITNCLFYSNGIGISIYGSTNCIINQNTIAENMYGIWLRQRSLTTGPGSASGTNNIVWGNITNILISDNSTLDLDYSDIQGDMIFPGEGNLNVEPLFVNPTKNNYQLSPNSPLNKAGYYGTTVGMISQPGGIPAEPLNLIALSTNLDRIILKWLDNSENEKRFLIQISTNGNDWINLDSVSENTDFYVFTNVIKDIRYYFRVRAENDSGKSEFSNIASAIIQTPTFYYGGILNTNTVWDGNGVFIVNSNLLIPSGVTLRIMAGATIKISSNTIIRSTNGGSISIEGSDVNPVKILSLDTSNTHREISAYGAGSSLTIHFADVTGVQATVYHGATGLIEDSFFHDYNPAGADILTHPIILTYYPAEATIRRCHFKDYYELLLRDGLHLVEYCLFEDTVGDALDFDAAAPGTVVRQCTFRRGMVENVDGIDIGNDGTRYSTFLTVESCIIHDFPFDKGVSIGDGSADIVVRNCLIYNCNSGIAVKDECTATIYNCTLVSNTFGINLKAKYPTQYQGGRATNTYNNIIWHNGTQILVTNNPIIVVNYSDIQGTNWPGVGNISSDPLFKNPSIGDFRLMDNSPCIGSGSNGVNMGVIYPIGGLPDTPANFKVIQITGTTAKLSWEPPTNFFSGYILEKSSNGSEFFTIAELPPTQTSYTDSSVVTGNCYYYRLKATNFIGSSFYTDTITVNTGEEKILIDLSGINIQSGIFRIFINSQRNQSFVLEASENLLNWIPVYTNSAVNGMVELFDIDAVKHQKRFYRISIKQ